MAKDAPICSKCGGTGHGVQFSIFSPHGFGTYCVECEKAVNAQVSGTDTDK